MVRPLTLKDGSTLIALLRHEAQQRKDGEIPNTDRAKIARGELTESDEAVSVDPQTVMNQIMAQQSAKRAEQPTE